MGFYGRTYEQTIGDFFQTVNFSRAYTDNAVARFPGDKDSGGAIIVPDQIPASTTKKLTATVPAEGMNIIAGNKWIQFVVNTENADMNKASTDSTYGLTIYHKKAEGSITDQVINFSEAVLVDGDGQPIKDDSDRCILGYGKTIAVNNLEFDAAGHAKGAAAGLVHYSLPKIVDYEDPLYNETFQNLCDTQYKATHEIDNTEFELTIKEALQDYPFSARTIFPSLVEHEYGIATLDETINDPETGLIIQTESLTTKVADVESVINEDILPALDLVPGVAKPGFEFNEDNKAEGNETTVKYKSFLVDNDTNYYKAGNRGTVLNRHNLSSLVSYEQVTFGEGKSYAPNLYYRKEGETYILAEEPESVAGTTYYQKGWKSPLSATNVALGDYSLASGYATRALGNCSQSQNGKINGEKIYPSTAYGTGSHAEGFSDIQSQKIIIQSDSNLSEGKIVPHNNFGGLWTNAFSSDRRKNTKVYVGLDGEQSHYIFPAIWQGTYLQIENPNGIQLLQNLSNFETYTSLAYGEGSHVEGTGTISGGNFAHAEGQGSMALGVGSHAEGGAGIATGEYAHAEGKESTATGNSAHSEGSNSNASGEAAHAEGNDTEASGNYAHAEGDGAVASGPSSHAEGGKYGGVINRALGEASHVEGAGCTAEGIYSHAGGQASNTPSGFAATFAHGVGVIAPSAEGAAAFGRWNAAHNSGDNIPIFVIGNGNIEGDQTNRRDVFRAYDHGCNVLGVFTVETGNVTVKQGNLIVEQGSLQVDKITIGGKTYTLSVDGSGNLKATEVTS